MPLDDIKAIGEKMSEVEPFKQSVLACLSNKKYDIDFYQREYVWNKETVDTLLNDVVYSFNIAYEERKQEDFSQALIDKFNWYYLNVFITNRIDGKIYIVDGQQRLSTLTLISVYLYHHCEDEKLKNVLESCILSTDLFEGSIFNIDNNKRKKVMQSIYDDKPYTEKYACQTEKTIIERYKDISDYFAKEQFDQKKLKVFIAYFLYRLVLVELSINKDDTPMVFEVINDRGESLKPFEILKGKLIGALPKTETEKYNDLWEASIKKLPEMEDAFFADYIKSHFIYSRNSKIENLINNEYHRFLFSQNEISNKIGFQRQNENQVLNIKNFLEINFQYYSTLYSKIRKNVNEYLIYDNQINGLSGVYQNILAACKVKDCQENEKIFSIAKEIDRLYVLLQLNQVYDSNEFQNISYDLNERLHNEDLENYRNVFNEIVANLLRVKRNKENITKVLDYETFSKNSYGHLNIRILRYILARVESYICDNLHLTMQNSIFDIATKTSEVKGYHIEHIFSENNSNRSYFDTEEEFEDKRNYIGGLLLLRGRSNISSGNEEYEDKLKTYSNGLIWGHTLCNDFYHAHPEFIDFNNQLEKEIGISFKPIEKFDKNALVYRSKLLYELIKRIWEIE